VAAIVDGLKAQALGGPVSVGSDGEKVQLSVTVAPKLVAGATGATVKAKPVPGTPELTVAEVTPVLIAVKAGALTVSVKGGEVLEALYGSPP
jgi:hypothetical protein